MTEKEAIKALEKAMEVMSEHYQLVSTKKFNVTLTTLKTLHASLSPSQRERDTSN